MTAITMKVSDNGLHIPKELFYGWDEVEISKENGNIFIRPVNQTPRKLTEAKLLADYREMAAEEEQEREALEWCEALVGDVLADEQ